MKTIARLITALVLFSVPAFSQGKDFTIFAGLQIPGKITLTNAASTGTSGATQIITDPKNAGTYGIRFGHGKFVGGEHTVAYSSNFMAGKADALILNSNFRIQAPTPVLRPYATAGLGTIATWGGGVSDIGAKFAVNYGGGVKVMAGPVGVNVSLRGYTLPSVQSQTLNLIDVDSPGRSPEVRPG